VERLITGSSSSLSESSSYSVSPGVFDGDPYKKSDGETEGVFDIVGVHVGVVLGVVPNESDIVALFDKVAVAVELKEMEGVSLDDMETDGVGVGVKEGVTSEGSTVFLAESEDDAVAEGVCESETEGVLVAVDVKVVLMPIIGVEEPVAEATGETVGVKDAEAVAVPVAVPVDVPVVVELGVTVGETVTVAVIVAVVVETVVPEL